MEKGYLKFFLLIVLISFLFNFNKFAFAQTPTLLNAQEFLGQTAKETGFTQNPKEPTIIIGNLINYLLTLLGIVFVGLILYGGFQWMTAGGNEEKIKKAKTTLTRAIIGLVIVLAAYSITWFVVNSLINATLEPTP